MSFDALQWGNYLLFVALAIIIILSSITVSYVVDTLGKRTRFSGALVAGTLVAFVSSLPEFTSSLTSVMNQPHLFSSAIGNLIGGNLFRTFMLALLCIVFIVAMKKAKTTKIQVCLIIVQIVVVVLNLVMMIEYPNIKDNKLLYSFMVVDILCLGLYGFLIWFMVKFDKNTAKDMDEKKHLSKFRQGLMEIKIRYVMLIFTVASLLIVGCSICISLSTEWIKTQIPAFSDEGSAFGSSILLGIVTSIPEIVTVVTLLKLGDVDAAITDILGSNMFSLVIMSFIDLISWNIVPDSNARMWDSPGSIHINFWFTIELFFLGGVLLVNYLHQRKKINKQTHYGLVATCLALLFMCYVISILQESGVIPFIPFQKGVDEADSYLTTGFNTLFCYQTR